MKNKRKVRCRTFQLRGEPVRPGGNRQLRVDEKRVFTEVSRVTSMQRASRARQAADAADQINISGELVLGCIEAKFCKKICV